MKKIFIFINLIYMLLVIVACTLIFNQNYVDKDLSKVKLENVNKLMIVAHPDDELLWGGSHLLDDDYLVVCITCGPNITRVNEFEKVMKKTNDEYIMLGYPDKRLNIRSNWNDEKDDIYKDIYDIISLKNWDLIVTHNKQGEYGHVHHKMTHEIVVDVYNDLNRTDDLYFFGKYYTKSRLNKLTSKPDRISDINLEKKNELIDLYKTQSFIKDKFSQMFAYEDWTKYDNIISLER